MGTLQTPSSIEWQRLIAVDSPAQLLLVAAGGVSGDGEQRGSVPAGRRAVTQSWGICYTSQGVLLLLTSVKKRQLSGMGGRVQVNYHRST